MVRLIKTELYNLKSVSFGMIEYMNYSSVKNDACISIGDIVGIYGQNGSGKTAMIEGIDILRYIISGRTIPADQYAGMMPNQNSQLAARFFVKNNSAVYLVEYRAKLGQRIVDGNVQITITHEEISYWLRGSQWKRKRTIIADNPYYDDALMLNESDRKIIYSDDIREYENLDFVKSIQRIAIFSAQKGCSLFFNNVVIKSLNKYIETENEEGTLAKILFNLNCYAEQNLMVIKVNQLAMINANNIIPVNVHNKSNDTLMQGSLPLVMNGAGTIPKIIYPTFETIVTAINVALKAIIPDLQLIIRKGIEEKNEKGIELINLEVYSQRKGNVFLTKYESEGIKRIISLLSCLIAVYNDESVCLVVDELDSGIFEYLLGELLGVLYEGAKGQLIFTSHNLRAFEKLPNKNIVCSTANPDNRFIRLQGIKVNHNRRDFYIRALTLGGQKEVLYDQTELESIAYAFRHAEKKDVNKASFPLSEEFMKVLQNEKKN